ncbi:uncharacterized protein ACIB01_011138 isoform 1-T4 [Guaruba guarouba]
MPGVTRWKPSQPCREVHTTVGFSREIRYQRRVPTPGISIARAYNAAGTGKGRASKPDRGLNCTENKSCRRDLQMNSARHTRCQRSSNKPAPVPVPALPVSSLGTELGWFCA